VLEAGGVFVGSSESSVVGRVWPNDWPNGVGPAKREPAGPALSPMTSASAAALLEDEAIAGESGSIRSSRPTG
jgi:hypothetical protein